MSAGTGVGSVQTPFSWCFGFVMNPVPPTQLVEPSRVPLQYWVCTPRPGAAADVREERVEVGLERLVE